MLLDIILLAISIVLILVYIKDKTQIKLLKMKIAEIEQRGRANQEEFTLGLKKLNSEFTDHILLDPLTGLPGREAFEDRLQQTLNQSHRFHKSFGVILLDIHEFHVINEAQGYEVGDKLLREVAKRLQGVIRQIDTMTRYAGNTFVFLLPQLSLPETAAYVAQRLLDHILLPFQIEDKKLFISASIGVAIYPTDGHDIKTLLLNANDALHQAKVHGSGRYQFYRQELHALGERELSINAFFNNPDFLANMFIYYQPHMNVVKNEVVSIQAIPHLQLPNIGLITFSDFAKIAENNSKVLEIGEWLLRNAIMQFQKWHKEGFSPEYLAVNVTLRQIENPQFIYKVSQILQDFQMNPKNVIFEISGENLLTSNSSTGLEKAFSMLSHLGIQISINVFALGQFALQKITKLPITYLKIDAKLIQDKKDNQENEAIVHMIVNLAKDMKICISAEGVTNEIQKDLLLNIGCEVMQGPLFGEPLPVETMIKHM